jgi:hypothetical protein
LLSRFSRTGRYFATRALVRGNDVSFASQLYHPAEGKIYTDRPG